MSNASTLQIDYQNIPESTVWKRDGYVVTTKRVCEFEMIGLHRQRIGPKTSEMTLDEDSTLSIENRRIVRKYLKHSVTSSYTDYEDRYIRDDAPPIRGRKVRSESTSTSFHFISEGFEATLVFGKRGVVGSAILPEVGIQDALLDTTLRIPISPTLSCIDLKEAFVISSRILDGEPIEDHRSTMLEAKRLDITQSAMRKDVIEKEYEPSWTAPPS